MIESEMEVLIIKVASMGLLPSKHLGMRLNEIFPEMKRLVKIIFNILLKLYRKKNIRQMFVEKEENLKV